MLFRNKFLEGIRTGAVTVAFRRWRKPTVRTGGALLTPVGQLSIKSVKPVGRGAIRTADARRAGYASIKELLDELDRRPDGEIYRIELGPLRADPRIALRNAAPASGDELDELRERLRRLDATAASGPWTLRTLKVLSAHPGVRAGDVCTLVNQDKDRFKTNVRKLKSLGLTESLGIGYRVSARGAALLRTLGNAEP